MSDTVPRRLLRRLLRMGAEDGVVAKLARVCGRHIGWRLDCGRRVLIDNPKEFIQGHLLEHGVYEPSIAGLIRKLLSRESVFFDVGANIGCHTLEAASCGARVHSFEPAPHLRARLIRHVELNRLETHVTVHAEAAGAQTGEAILHVAERDDDGSHSLIEGIEATSVRHVTVGTVTLDDVVKERKADDPDLIKIDIEGYEARALDGAAGLISSPLRPSFIVETGDAMASAIDESAASVLARLMNEGYSVFRIESPMRLRPVARNEVSCELWNYLAIHPSRRDFSRLNELILPLIQNRSESKEH